MDGFHAPASTISAVQGACHLNHLADTEPRTGGFYALNPTTPEDLPDD
jgi:hypothetical protein